MPVDMRFEEFLAERASANRNSKTLVGGPLIEPILMKAKPKCTVVGVAAIHPASAHGHLDNDMFGNHLIALHDPAAAAILFEKRFVTISVC